MLGGVRIAYSHGVVAHSDGDVVIHALCDAVLGALGDGDIGQHFPDSDPRYRGADSRVFLRVVAERMQARGGPHWSTPTSPCSPKHRASPRIAGTWPRTWRRISQSTVR